MVLRDMCIYEGWDGEEERSKSGEERSERASDQSECSNQRTPPDKIKTGRARERDDSFGRGKTIASKDSHTHRDEGVEYDGRDKTRRDKTRKER